jgi:hypothetical protein
MHSFELDPYAELPFVGYLCDISKHPETYWSLMHFLEAEKYRGVDDQYRRYLLSIRNIDDFKFETSAIPTSEEAKESWRQVREKAIHTGLLMQFSQNKDHLAGVLLSDSFECRSSAIRVARDRILERVSSKNPWLRVLFIGSQGARFTINSLTSVFDHIFSQRLPDEILALIEPGVGYAAAKYAQESLTPFRAFDCAPASITNAVERASHVFQIGCDNEVDEHVITAVQRAKEQGKTVHILSSNQ